MWYLVLLPIASSLIRLIENLFVAGTYKKILSKIAATALRDAHMHLSTRVHAIKLAETSQGPGQGTVAVSTSSETAASLTERLFDATILTASLGCLKRGQPRIIPPLPSRLQTAVQNLSYGNLEKAYITFPSAFWSPTAPQSFPTFVDFLHPLYDAASNPTHEIVDCMALSALPAEVAHPTLLFYFHGPYAQRLVASFAEHEHGSSDYVSAITAAFEPYYSRLPHYDPASAECKPVAAVATAWSVDELAGNGSYTNFQVPSTAGGVEARLDKDIEALRKGCPERSLWIAGEHTAPFVALGTITGAYWSGEAVARRVVDWFEGKEDVILGGNEGVPANTVQTGKGEGEGDDLHGVGV